MQQVESKSKNFYTEVYLERVAQIVHAYRGKGLSTIEARTVQGCLQGKSYKHIASMQNYDDNYVGDLARKLFGILSQYLEKDVAKSNLLYICESCLDDNGWENLKNGIIKANT